MINKELFADNGGVGYVLKELNPRAELVTLKIRVIAGKMIPRPNYDRLADAFVVISINGDDDPTRRKSTHSISEQFLSLFISSSLFLTLVFLFLICREQLLEAILEQRAHGDISKRVAQRIVHTSL